MGRKKATPETAEPKTLPFHPLAEQYPLMSAAEIEALADDIREYGLVQPIVVWKQQIIDGRNRYLACTRYGLPCRFHDYRGNEESLEAYIASLNEHRRHLTSGDRERIQAERIKRIKRVQEARKAGKSLRTIAEEEGVSHTQIKNDLEESSTVKGFTVESAKPEEKPQAEAQKQPETVIGKNGKTYKASSKKPEPEVKKEEPKKPESEKKEPAKVIPPSPVDGWGIPVQPHAQEAFEAVEHFNELIQLIQKAKKKFNEVASMPGGAFLTLPGVAQVRRGKKTGTGDEREDRYVHSGLEGAYRQIKDAIPTHTVCPYRYIDAPHPEGCGTCLGKNWTPALGKHIPPEAIERAKESFSV